jgi:large subunit ribosomal protein L5
MMTRLEKKYKEDVIPQMMKKFGYKNKLQVPRLEKIALNTCLKEAIENKKILDSACLELKAITGQKPIITKAKKSVAGFKLRENMPIGAKVTLRRSRMYEFLDRLLNIALPRIRDFRGVSPKSFDVRGNYTLGIKEQTIFPEIDVDKVEKVHGMDITIVTGAKTPDEGRELLRLLGMPFAREET